MALMTPNLTTKHRRIGRALCGTFFCATLSLGTVGAAQALAQENAAEIADGVPVVLDAIVAVVEGDPITLSDLRKRLPESNLRTLNDVRNSSSAVAMLDSLIMEELLKVDAEARRIGVSGSEIDSYVQEVAARNGLSEDEFKVALQAEGKSFDVFRDQVKLEIIKSKLAGRLFQEGVGVSDSEVEEYMESHRAMYAAEGESVRLRQIFVALEGKQPGEAEELISGAEAQLRSGGSFAAVAAAVSEAPDAKNGGLLGIVPLADLSDSIRNSIQATEEGDVSQVTRTAVGLHLFLVEQKYSGQDEGTSDEKLKEAVRKEISEKKLQNRLEQYFVKELQKNYVVDKKIEM